MRSTSNRTRASILVQSRGEETALAWASSVGPSFGLAGVAVMLWFVSPVVHATVAWPLLIVPLVPALGLAWCLVQLGSTNARQSFERLRQQWAADGALFKEATLR